MTKIHNMSIIFAAVGLKLTRAILLSWFWPERMTRLPSFVKKNVERMFSQYVGLVKTAASNTLWSRLKEEVVTFLI